MKSNLLSRRGVMQLGNMSLAELQQSLTVMSLRAQSLCGRTEDGRPLGAATAERLNNILAELSDPAKVAANEKALADAQKDPTLRAQLCGIRTETFNNYVISQPNFLNFHFEIINLGANEERPYHQNTTMQEVEVYKIGGSNRPKQVKVTKDDIETAIDLEWISTSKVRYRKNDIYKGNIVQTALATLMLAHDMAVRLDVQAKALLDAYAFGDFTLTGRRTARTWNAHSHINPANLPTTNDIVVYKDAQGVGNIDEDGSATTRFGFETLDAILDYCNRCPKALDGSKLAPTGRILMPPPHIKHIASGVSKTAVGETTIAKELMLMGWSGVTYQRINWVFIPDESLDPDAGLCYPEFNKKAGQAYFKPSMDKEFTSEGDYEFESQNEEERWMKKVFGAALNSATRHYIARFQYKS